MRITVAVLLIIFGICILPKALPLGIAMVIAGGWLFEGVTPGQEERFQGVLFLLGGLGALAVVVQFVYHRITALL